MSESNKEQKIWNRYSTFCNRYNKFIGKYPDIEPFVYLNLNLLYLVLVAYYDDIERFKAYSGSKVADRFKRAAFSIKWISKIRPVQIKSSIVDNGMSGVPFDAGADCSYHVMLINSLFAIYAGSCFLFNITPDDIPDDYYKDLIYTTFYSDIDAKQLAGALLLLEKYAIAVKP